MPNTISVGVAFSDPALVAGTTITGAAITGATITSTTITSPTITSPTITGGVMNGTLGATTPAAATVTTFTGARTTVAAAGSTNADAGAIPAASFLCTVTGGDATKGVILPAMSVGQVIYVKNNAAAVLKVYPYSGAAINGLTATTGALSVAANAPAGFFCDAAAQIWSLPLLPS